MELGSDDLRGKLIVLAQLSHDMYVVKCKCVEIKSLLCVKIFL